MEVPVVVLIISCAAALVFGAVIAYLVLSKKSAETKKELELERREAERLSAENASEKQRSDALNSKNAELLSRLSSEETALNIAINRQGELSENIAVLKNELAESQEKLSTAMARASAAEQSYKDVRDWINKADLTLKDSFSSLSKDISENNSKVFLESANDKLNDFASKLKENLSGNNEAVSGIITPVGKELGELRTKVEELEKNRASAYSGLTTQVEGLQKQNMELKNATDLLNSTLKNNAQRGKWGEEQLRRIAELCGMVDHIDFEEQHVNTEGSRPDMVIFLTGGRSVPVDSKVPMNSYMLYLDDTEEAKRTQHLAEHVKALRAHIDALYRKAYWKSEDRSVEMVAMVVPYESGLSAAFASDSEIFSYAMSKNVLLLSPMTFYAFLKSVSIGWKENAMSSNAKEIAKLSTELISRFEVFLRHFTDVDKSLSSARKAYDAAVSSYNSRLLPTFSRFQTLNSGTKLLEENEQASAELTFPDAEDGI